MLLNSLWDIFFNLIKVLYLVVPLILSIAFLTLAERKLLGSIQIRKGPNVVGVYGILQPIIDGLKLLLKEVIVPVQANFFVFFISPIVCFMLALGSWAVIPFGEGLILSDINIGVLYVFAISSLSIYSVLCSGWSSNSKYAFLGSLRSTAQMISYEVSIGLVFISVILMSGSFNLLVIVGSQKLVWYIVPLFPSYLMFFVSALAETNRAPFDLPESESELVSGYNVEYSSMMFAMFFLGEYCHIIFMSFFISLVFLGGWLSPFEDLCLIGIPGVIWLVLKCLCNLFLFIWIRAIVPRMRFDQLMYLCWKSFLPLSLSYVIGLSGVIWFFDWFPVSV
uniref:NADH-ubiquinone oxidoreductase chain 1 n=1 Tax=Sphaerothecum destruens TaxID=42893 RepID=A0A6H2U2A4_9EUKA|nr:NADH dehydrogenase subunit I [Sphaerothecum destruens]QID02698.1 NADH dehydrogenase subunit I [Sphaerothecum destruens]